MTCFDEQPDAPLHGECAAEINRLTAERDRNLRRIAELEALNGALCRDSAGFVQERDALAAQNQVMRAALEDCLDDSRQVLGDYEQVYGENYKQHRVIAQRETVAKAVSALALPDLSADILRARDARVNAELLYALASGQDAFDGGTGLLPFELRKIAEELEQAK